VKLVDYGEGTVEESRLRVGMPNNGELYVACD